MATIKIVARDSSSAMEQVSKKLGADAYILSTTSKDGGVEIEATNDPIELKKHSQNSKKSFSGLIQKELSNVANFPVSPGLSARPNEFGNLSNFRSNIKEVEFEELKKSISNLTDEIRGMYITNSAGLGVEIGESNFVKLQNAGFDSALVKTLAASFYGLSYEKGRVAFMKSLANRLTLTNVAAINERVIFVNGMSGVGKTTLAAKIAAEHLEASSRKVVMATLSDPQETSEDSLRHYARMLNLPVIRLTPETLSDTICLSRDRFIIDVSLQATDAKNAILQTQEVLGNKDVISILAIPGGASQQFINNQASAYNEFSPLLALTKLDECDITPRELSEFFTNKMKICYLTGSKSILRGLSYCNSDILTQYLIENC